MLSMVQVSAHKGYMITYSVKRIKSTSTSNNNEVPGNKNLPFLITFVEIQKLPQERKEKKRKKKK